jgi:hypothetical protein
VEGLVNGWWVGGEGGLSVGRIGGKGGRVKKSRDYSGFSIFSTLVGAV